MATLGLEEGLPDAMGQTRARFAVEAALGRGWTSVGLVWAVGVGLRAVATPRVPSSPRSPTLMPPVMSELIPFVVPLASVRYSAMVLRVTCFEPKTW